jgi:hypothetical protein
MRGTLLPITKFVSPQHEENASFPMSLTLSGIVTLVRTLQLSNAPTPMQVTGLPPSWFAITKSPEVFAAKSVIVAAVAFVMYVYGPNTSAEQNDARDRQRAARARRSACMVGLSEPAWRIDIMMRRMADAGITVKASNG